MNLLKTKTARILFAVLLGVVALAPAVSAAPTTSTFQILLDLDNRQNTGCDVAALTGTFKGVEQILITTVTAGGPVTQVTAVQVRNCVSGTTFGPPAAVPAPAGHPLPWNIGVGNGTGGTDVIETYLPLSMVTVNPLHVVQVGVLAFDSGNVLRDELLKAQPTPGNGPPILLNAALALVDIPTLSEWGLMLLGLTLAGAAVAVLRRRRTAASVVLALLLLGSAGLAWGAVITCDLNGNTTAEWIGGTLLATEPTSDAPVGTDIQALFGFKDGTLNALVFRIDADLPAPVFNQSPTANNDTSTVTEDSGANTITVLTNDSDPESDPMVISSVTQPAHGTVAITGSGTTVSYTPNANYCNNPPGSTLDTFTYTLAPGGPGTTATVAVTVNCVDDNPVAVNDAATVAEDAPATAVNVLANDTDVDGGTKTITSVTQPANGTVVITGGGTGLTYQPNANYCNSVSGTPDTFTYTLTPGGSTATVSVTVTCGDDPPTAVADAATVNEDSGANAVNVLANDTDFDGGPISVASVTQPANGTVAITGGGTGLTYTPNADYCNNPPGTTLDTFTYTLAPGGSTATVTMTVTCADDNPVAVADAATVNEDSGANAIDVLANDTDADSGTKSVASVTQPANGTVAITGGGTGVSYTPNADYCNSPSGSPDTFTYTLTPGGSTATVSVTVACVNDAPVVNPATFVVPEHAPNGTTVGTPVTFTDPDAGQTHTFAITAGNTSGAFAINPSTGQITVTNSAALDFGINPSFSLTVQVTDNGTPALSGTATVTINLGDVNDSPVVNPATFSLPENSPNGTNVGTVTFSDPDSGQTHTFAITGGNTSGAFAINPATGQITVANSAALDFETTPTFSLTVQVTDNGSPVLAGSATVTINLTNVDDSPVIDLDANDDKGTTGSDFTTTFTEGSPAVLIEDPADATVTDVDSANLASLTVTITNILDPGTEILSTDVTGTSITGNYVPATGVLTLTGPDTVANFQTVLRKVQYQNTDVDPDATARVIQFVANDGSTNSNTATAMVNIVSTDTAPTAVADSATVAEDSSNNPIDVLANDTDPDNGPKTVASVTQPANGTVVITGGGTGVSYTPNADYCNSPSGSPDTFTYTLSPGSSSATVSVTVTCSDDNPTAMADTATVVEDSSANPIDVLANDTDADGGPKSVASVTQPANGTVVITGGGTGVSYTPNANYCNSPSGSPDTFTYTLTPGSSSATVSVTVTCVDDNPTAVNDAATVAEDSSANAIDVLANDTDPDGGTKSVASVTQPANGTVVITGGGTGVSYTPNANYCNNPSGTPDTFTYTLSPGGSSATVSVTVTCVDDAPVAVADAATVVEDSGATAIPVLANDTDIDSGPKSIASVTQPANGSVVITGGGTGLTYAPNANYCNSPSGSPDTFTYTLTPGSSSTTVSVTVTCVDDNPVAVADATTVTEDSGANAINVLANDTDIDNGPKSVASVTQPANGTVAITGGGTGVSYTPNANYCNNPPGTTLETFTYTLTPGSSSTTVTVTVTCVDDNPVAVADAATVVEDSVGNAIDVLANDTDVDGGSKSVTSVTQPANGTVAITGGGTGVSYTPNANYCNNPPGTTLETFTYTLTPGGSSTTVTVTVTCVDDPPVAVNDSATVTEDDPATSISVLANDTDIDGGPKSISAVTQPANGTVVITGGGTGLTYQPNANYCNSVSGPLDTFTYTLTPGGSSASVSVTVICVNDAPVLANNPITYTTAGNTQLHVAGATRPGVASISDAQSALAKANPSDIDGPSPILVVAASGTSANGGSFTIAADGSFSYVPPAGFTGTDSFTYTVTDSGSPAATTTGTISITVGQRVWYIRDVVDGNNPAGGDGRSTNAFDSIAAFNAATTNNGDIIYVFEGNTGTTPLTGSITLKDGQKLWGQGVDLNVPSFGVLVSATNRPRIRSTAASTPAVSVPATAGNRNNVEIRGLDLETTGATSNAIDVISSGANTVGITIVNNNVRGATGRGINLAEGGSGAFTATLDNNALAATGNAFDARTTIAGAGALTVSFTNNAVVSGATGISIDGSTGGTTTITGFSNNAVSKDNVGTGIAITSARFDGTPGGGYQTVSGGSTVVGSAGVTNGVGGSGVVMTNVSGDLAFTDLDIFAEGGAALRITGTGAVNTGAGTGTQVTVGAGVAIFEATGGPAVDVTNATIDLQPSSIKSTNSTSTGVSLDTVTGTFAAGSGSTITNATGTSFNVNAGTATISYDGTITNSTGRSVSVTSKTSGSTTFNGTITATGGTGIFLNSNTGSTIGFTKQIVLSTGANAAFTATGGGTVTATDTTSTLTTTTGVALNVANTTIGAGGLKFASISAGTAASGPSSGIVLNTTGSSGSLTVNGGTIQKTTSHGVSLTSTLNPTFKSVTIKNTGGSGVKGTGVTNFSFTNGTIDTTGTAAGDSNLAFDDSAAGTENNLSGTVTITGNTLSNAFYHGIDILNYNGTVVDANLSSNTLTSSTVAASSQGSGIRLIAFGSATTGANITKATIANNVISNFPTGDGIQVQGGNANAGGPGTTLGTPSTANVIAITGNRVAGQSTANKLGGNGILVSLRGSGQGNFDISNNGTVANPITNVAGIGIATSVFGPMTVTTNVNNNVVVANNTFGSQGILAGIDNHFGLTDAGTLTATITNNTVSGTDGNGIYALARNSSATLKVKIQNNTVAAPLGGVRPGIRIDSGSASGNTTVCLNISSNTSAGSGGAQGLGLRKQGTAPATNAFGVNGMVATSSPGVESYVDGLNPAGGGTLLISATSGFTNCSLP
jgi:hypothetical protein